MGQKSDTVAMQRRLKANGYEFVRQRGSHMIYRKGDHEVTVNLKLHKVVAKRLIKEIEANA